MDVLIKYPWTLFFYLYNEYRVLQIRVSLCLRHYSIEEQIYLLGVKLQQLTVFGGLVLNFII